MSKEFIEAYLKETTEIAMNVNRDDINKAIEILFEAWKNNKKIFTIGNGGSASTASHFAADLAKTVSHGSSDREVKEGKKGFIAFCLNDNPALTTAWINDSGWENVYFGQLSSLLDENDVLLILSVHGGSGWSGNIVKAMELAKKRNARIVGFAGYDGGMLKKLADACIVVPKDSTPHVEGFHSVLQHLIVFRLKEMIQKYSNNSVLEKLQNIGSQCLESVKINQLLDEFPIKK